MYGFVVSLKSGTGKAGAASYCRVRPNKLISYTDSLLESDVMSNNCFEPGCIKRCTSERLKSTLAFPELNSLQALEGCSL